MPDPVEQARTANAYAPPKLIFNFENTRPTYGHLERELELERHVEELKRQVRELHCFVIEQESLSSSLRPFHSLHLNQKYLLAMLRTFADEF